MSIRGPYVKRDVLERFMSKVDVTGDCWRWMARVNEAGYGTFNPAPGIKKYAHRWVYEYAVEPIPQELQLDHLCFNRRCVNPDHLEPVTPQENAKRNSFGRRTHCINGHEFTPENTYRRRDNPRRRQCRACNAARQRARNAVHKSTDPQKGCPGDPASNVNKTQPANSTEFLGL